MVPLDSLFNFPLTFFTVLFFVAFIIRNRFGLVLSGIYLLSTISGYVLYRTEYIYDFSTTTFFDSWAMPGYCGLILLGIIPAFFFRFQSLNLQNSLDKKMVNRIASLLIPFFLFSVLYQSPYAIYGMSMGAGTLRYLLNTGEYQVLPTSPLTTLSVAIATFSPYFIVLWYIWRPYMTRCKSFLFALGGFSYVVSSMCFMARDGIIWYGVFNLFGCSIMSPQWTKIQRRWVFSVILILLVLIAGGLWILSVQRVEENAKATMIGATLGYFGQQPVVFAETVTIHPEQMFYGGYKRFPLFMRLALQGQREIKSVFRHEWQFGTFAKELYLENGWGTAFTIMIGFCILFSWLFRSAEYWNFYSYLLFVILYIQFMIQGVFYFRLGNFSGNFYILMTFGLALALQIWQGRNNPTAAAVDLPESIVSDHKP